MKAGRNLYVAVTAVAAGTVLLCGFAGWGALGAYSPGVVSVCCLAAAAGVLWLGWRCLGVTGAITSVARQLEDEQSSGIEAKGNALIEQLSEAIDKRFSAGTDYTEQMERQIKDLRIQNQLLQGQKRHAEEIIYSIRDAVIVVDEFDKLLMANEAACRLFGFDFKTVRHRPLGEVVDEGKNEFVDFLRQSRNSKVRGARRQMEFADDGRVKTFDCIVSCVYDQKERICGAVAVMHDVTREKEVSQMKNDFVSHVSHELKTPLASITAYAEMLADGEADDENTRKEFYSVIQNQAKRLNRLIEEILNVSRIESGLIKVEKQPVSLTMLIVEQLEMIRGYAEEKDIEIISQKPIVFDRVYADKDMISQVIVNLLSNAVKYTMSGGSVRVWTEVDENAGTAKVSVTDTGVGIPAEELEHVFDKFYRVGANKGVAKGTGLGLNLVKQIVEKVHNGRVFVESRVGVGTTFGFELPLASVEAVKV